MDDKIKEWTNEQKNEIKEWMNECFIDWMDSTKGHR